MNKKNIKKYMGFIVIAVLSASLMLATTQIGSKKYYPFEEEELQILFFGDSNLANRVEGKDIADRVKDILGCEVYNAAIGGTTAAKVNTENYFDWTEDLFCFYNVSKLMETEEYQILLDSQKTMLYNEQDGVGKMNMVVNIEYDKIDYIVVSYGLNDYMTGVPAYCGEDPFDETTYEGAIRSSVDRITKLCPNSTIILSGITYCAYTGEEDNGLDGYSFSWGGGYIDDYRDAAAKVASEYENVIFMDNLEMLGIDSTNHEQYLWDKIHFDLEARERYVDYLVSIIRENESNKDE